MADEPKNTGLGAGEQGWLRRQRAAEGRMVSNRAERERIMEIRKRHRERVEAEKAARENGEEVPSEEIEVEPFDYRNKDGFQMPTGEEEESEEETETEETETEETETEETETEETETEEAGEEEESSEEEEQEEPLKDVGDMTRNELTKELKDRDNPVVGKPNIAKLRETLTELRSGEGDG